MDRTTRRGRRCSAARAYLHPARRRPNLTVRTGALTTRVRFAGRRATGVDYAADGRRHEVHAAREVILAGGAINSPQLLMLSGHRRCRRSSPRTTSPSSRDLPGVGRNLQDHLEIYVQHACTQPISLYGSERPLSKLRIGARLAVPRPRHRRVQPVRGGRLHPLARGRRAPRPAVSFPADRDELRRQQSLAGPRLPGPCRADAPDLGRPGAPALRRSARAALDPLQLHGNRRRPPGDARRGPPDPRDLCAAGVRPLSRPGAGAGAARSQTDAEIDAFVRARAESAYHPSGTCKMGPDERSDARWSTANAASTASRPCAWSTPRSCRASSRATSTRPRSCWPRRPPT